MDDKISNIERNILINYRNVAQHQITKSDVVIENVEIKAYRVGNIVRIDISGR